MASDDSDPNVEYALSKLLQMGTVAEYQNEFKMLIKRVKPQNVRRSFFLNPGSRSTLHEPITLGNVEVLSSNFGRSLLQSPPYMKDKQEVKKADDLIENIKDEEGKNDEDQQVSQADDDTSNDDFDCSLPPYKGVDLTVEDVVFENTTSDLKKDEQGKKKKKEVIIFSEVGANKDNNPNGMFNDGGEVGYNKANGTWVPALRIKDGWYLFDGPGLSKESHSKSNLDVHLQFHLDRQDIGSQVKTWDPGIKIFFFKTTP
ncbi:hypothetical protein Tco_0998443 [Tanacetum coccineum]